jgi:hypothetical protein
VLKAECAERSTYSIPANPARGKEVKTKSRLVEINCRKTGLEVTCLTHLARSPYRPLKVRQLSSNLLAGKPRQNNDTSIERFPNECQGFSRSDTGDRCVYMSECESSRLPPVPSADSVVGRGFILRLTLDTRRREREQ